MNDTSGMNIIRDWEAEMTEAMQRLHKSKLVYDEEALAIQLKQLEEVAAKQEEYEKKAAAMKTFYTQKEYEEWEKIEKAKLEAQGITDADAQKAELARIKKAAKIKVVADENAEKLKQKQREKNIKKLQQEDKKKAKKEKSEAISKGIDGALSAKTPADAAKSGKALSDAISEAIGGGAGKALGGVIGGITAAVGVIGNFFKGLSSDIEAIGKNRSLIDTALQGSKRETYGNSYWDAISNKLVQGAGISPIVTQKEIVEQVKTLVNNGVAFDIEQRAFLGAIKDKVAATFEVNDKALRRLIRIQQEDSTANRLGMESLMTTFLNQMYETTEYMHEIASNVRSSMEEAQALMDATRGTELEFEVQKWLGSMYSLGVSDNAVNSIAEAVGKVAAGQIEGITGGGTGNLVVMAANEAGLSIADILKEGLDAKTTNKLLEAVVDYLQGIYNSTGNSKVLQQQIAAVYGLKASDLKAIGNLSASTVEIANYTADYGTMYKKLADMVGTAYERMAPGELIKNLKENALYSLASGIANNRGTAISWEAGNLINEVGSLIPGTWGKAIQAIGYTTLATTGLIGSIKSFGNILKGGGGVNIFDGAKILGEFGINGTGNVLTRGTTTGLTGSTGYTASESGSITTGSGKTADKALTEKENTTVGAQEAETVEETEDKILNQVTLIYELLNGLKDGNALRISYAFDSAFTRSGDATGTSGY